MSSTTPELGGQEDEDGEEFQPSEEHVEGQDHLGRARQSGEERGVSHRAQGCARDAQAREDRAERRTQSQPVQGHEQRPHHERRHVEEEEPQEGCSQALGDHTSPELKKRDGLRMQQPEQLLPGVPDEQDEPHHFYAAAR